MNHKKLRRLYAEVLKNTREGVLSLLIHTLQLRQLSLGREREREPESLDQLVMRARIVRFVALLSTPAISSRSGRR
jgi:hypothetical protein